MITFWAILIVMASIGIVAWPLLKGVSGRYILKPAEDTEVSDLLAQKDATLLAISELESDYNMGNLSRKDYQELRQQYEERAVALIKTVDGLRQERGLGAADDLDQEIEARVSELRAGKNPPSTETTRAPGRKRASEAPKAKFCPECGARLESSDLFCSGCGLALSLKCPNCSAAVETNDRFCSRCGAVLQAGEQRGKA